MFAKAAGLTHLMVSFANKLAPTEAWRQTKGSESAGVYVGADRALRHGLVRMTNCHGP